jgi:hypothetical protein
MAANGISKGKRREVVTLWMKQLLNLHERQGTSKSASAGWIGAVYALRAASRLDANQEWGKLGDEIISHLEQAYLAVMGPDAAKPVEVGRQLLQTQRQPDLAPLNVPTGPIEHAEVASNLRRAAGAAGRAAKAAPRRRATASKAARKPAGGGRASRRRR